MERISPISKSEWLIEIPKLLEGDYTEGDAREPISMGTYIENFLFSRIPDLQWRRKTKNNFHTAMNELFGRKFDSTISYLFNIDDIEYNQESFMRLLKLCRISGVPLKKKSAPIIFQFIEDLWTKKISHSTTYFIDNRQFYLLYIDSINLLKNYLPNYFTSDEYYRLEYLKTPETKVVYYFPRLLKLLNDILKSVSNSGLQYLCLTTLLNYRYYIQLSPEQHEVFIQKFRDELLELREDNEIPEEIWENSYSLFLQKTYTTQNNKLIDIRLKEVSSKESPSEITLLRRRVEREYHKQPKAIFSQLVNLGYINAEPEDTDYSTIVISKVKTNITQHKENIYLPVYVEEYENTLTKCFNYIDLFVQCLGFENSFRSE